MMDMVATVIADIASMAMASIVTSMENIDMAERGTATSIGLKKSGTPRQIATTTTIPFKKFITIGNQKNNAIAP